MSQSDILSHLRVLDVSDGVAGAHCTALLASLGAEVIKVESPQGDPSRQVGPFPKDLPHPERSALFLYENVGKFGITLDMHTKDGIREFAQLAQQSDVIVESFAPGALQQLGLGYGLLAQHNPRLVLSSITWFGQSGPYRDWAGGPMVTFAAGGLMRLAGEPGRTPLHLPSYVLERIVGISAFTATLAAAHVAGLTGKGQEVDVSFVETVASIHEFTVPAYITKGQIVNRVGNYALSWSIVPCKDGFLGFNAVSASNRWDRLCELLEMPDLRTDPRFADSGARNRNADELFVVLLEWAKDKPKDEVFTRAQRSGLAIGVVQDVDEAFAMEQLRARAFFVPVTHPEVGTLEYPGFPFHVTDPTTPHNAEQHQASAQPMGGRFAERPLRAPLLGEHNALVSSRLR
ncbi:MAG: CoA transferase [Dehalococcoidia bacterium]|nr:CoA transferase [Dehalococcoidia bacterium]